MKSTTTTKSPRHVLVVVTAKGCPACTAFHQNWPSIKTQLNGVISIVEIQQPSITNVFDRSKYPAGLDNYAGWFPTLLLVSRDEWKVDSTISHAVVFNGDIVNGKAKMRQNRIQMNAQNLINWINNSV